MRPPHRNWFGLPSPDALRGSLKIHRNDNAGNRIESTTGGGGSSGTVSYAWDQRNRVTSATSGTSETVYQYDTEDRPVQEDEYEAYEEITETSGAMYEVPSTISAQEYIYDGSNVSLEMGAETDDATTITDRYMEDPNGGAPLAQEDGSGNAQWLFKDQDGSVQDI